MSASTHLPTGLTRSEAHKVLQCMEGTAVLAARLLYGAGLQLLECLRLRSAFGILDSERPDVVYEDWYGHKLDQKFLELLRGD